jgi:AbrB family looped-hinge helix DNA binding protein
VIPANIRREFGIEPGDLVEFEERDDGILLRPVEAAPREYRWIQGR